MKQDDLDRALSGSREIRVSERFAAAVMVEVRREALAPPRLAFPWKRCVAGLATCVALTFASVVIALTAEPSQWSTPAWLDGVKVAAQSAALQWTAVALLVSLASSRWSMRLAGYRS